MVCKYCQAALEEGSTVCPACGKPVEEECVQETVLPEAEQLPEENAEAAHSEQAETAEEAAVCVPEEEETAEEAEEDSPAENAINREKAEKREKLFVRITAIVSCAVLLLAVFAGVWTAFGGSVRKNTLEGNASYEVQAGEAAQKADVVVARIGDAELSNSMLQMFYWDEIYNFTQKYYNYLSYLGLDFSQPLSAQTTDDGQTTWEQYFLEGALNTWRQYQALYLKAEADGFVPSVTKQEFLQNIPATLQEAATASGYATVNDMAVGDYGPGANSKVYEEYLRLCYTGTFYFDSLYAALEVTDAELEAYYEANGAKLKTNYGIDKQTGKLVDVRHILLVPEGGVEDETGNVTYSEKEWEACREKAQALLNRFLEGEATEEQFAKLATENTVDPGSKQTGGLYEMVYQGQMVPEFDAWCFDEAREPGDTDLVLTSYGYHIMYYIYGDEAWIRYSTEGILYEKGAELLQGILDAYPMEVYYNKIALGQIETN